MCFPEGEIFYPLCDCFCCRHNVVPSRKAVRKCLKCRPSLLGFLILEFLPAASQVVFNNVDTLWFGVAGAVLSYGVLNFRIQRHILSSSTRINRLVACFLARCPHLCTQFQNLVLLIRTSDTQNRTLTQSI